MNRTAGDPHGWLQNIRFIQASCYIPILILGTIGNVYVIIILTRVLRTIKSSPPIYLYILSLSSVDALFLTSSWLLIYYIFAATWQLGIVLCKLLWLGESLNKTFSVYLLVLLSMDRYNAVAHPMRRARNELSSRRSRYIWRQILPLTVIITITCLPIYVFTEVTTHKMPRVSGNSAFNGTSDFDWITLKVCRPNFPSVSNSTSEFSANTQNYYFIFLFIFYFIIPATLISTFYTLLLLKLRRAQARLGTRKKQRTAVTKSVTLVVLFYFVSWAPYWLFQVTIVVAQADLGMKNGFIPIAQTLIYSLPFINSGLNPILYGLLNRKLQQQYRESVEKTKSQQHPGVTGMGHSQSDSRLATKHITILPQNNLTTIKNTLVAISTRRMSSDGTDYDVDGILVTQSDSLLSMQETFV